MYLPIEHNGQTFNLVPQDSFYGTFAVMLDRETWAYDEEAPEEISERLGAFQIEHHYERVSAWTRYGFAVSVGSINEAVAHIVDNYRACAHGDATCLGGTKWNCDICGADFEREEEDGPEGDEDEDWDLDGPAHVREDIPWGTPDSWIPDNPNEDGFTQRDFI